MFWITALLVLAGFIAVPMFLIRLIIKWIKGDK